MEASLFAAEVCFVEAFLICQIIFKKIAGFCSPGSAGRMNLRQRLTP